MKYTFFGFRRKQYFFPITTYNKDFFLNFYCPYSRLGTILWFFYCKIKLFRDLFKVDDIRNVVDSFLLEIMEKEKTTMAFNIGTVGPEQKTTALGIVNDSGYKFFLKFGKSKIATNLIKNEYWALQKLINKKFAPDPIAFLALGNNTGYLTTEIVLGNKLIDTSLNTSVLQLLLDISHFDRKESNEEGVLFFNHGDFCPWNIIKGEKELTAIDWEMAGYYPLGFDLFSFLFQTEFLLTANRNIDSVLERNKKYIEAFFFEFGVDNFDSFLLEFVKIKFDKEYKKGNKALYIPYKLLLQYANEKI